MEQIENKFKGGEFLIKDFSFDDDYIPEMMDSDQKMVRDMVRDFVDNELAESAHILENQVPLMDKAAELGLVGANIPQKYGGQELGTILNTIIGEEMGRGDASFSTTFAAHTGIGMLPILYFGTEAQKDKYLPRLVLAELKAAYCLTEPGSGSDALGAKTKAILNEEGTHYLLTGQKMWISNAGFADVFIVFAQVDGDKFTGFIVEKGTEGMTLGAEEHKLGLKGSSTRQIFFDNAKVPAENILGEIGKGHLIAFNVLNIGRYKLGVLVGGGVKKICNIAVSYALEREQFKTPIANFGAIQFKLAQMVADAFVLETVNYRIANQLEDWKTTALAEGKSYEEAMLDAAEEYAIECAISKIYGSEAIDKAADELLQIHGGYGFSEEYLPARIYRDTRINRIYEGTNEINRLLLVNMLLRRVMKGELDMVGPAWAVQKELAGMPKMEQFDGPYASETKALSHFKKMLLMVAGAGAKYQMDGKVDLKNEQEVLMNMANMMIDVFNAESILARLNVIHTMDDNHLNVKEAVMKLYFHDAQDRLSKNATDALASFASGDELKIMLLGVKRFSKLEPVNVKELRRLIAQSVINNKAYPFEY